MLPVIRTSLSTLVRHCDRLLAVDTVEDWPRACNGLQVGNRGSVNRIAAAVDASLVTVRMAIREGADLLVVHHGLFWTDRQPWTGRNHELLRELVENDLAVYSAHLPLDVHRRYGNNALLCAALGLGRLAPFFLEKGQPCGLKALTSIRRDELARRFGKVIGKIPLVIPGGGEVCRRIGVVTGGAGDQLKRAADEGVDTFLTGEGPHWTHALAEELGVNVMYGGHYATETFGVKALAAHLSKKYGVPWVFLDHPTGL
jgi:dinuclear metal center YbgI/SA1388 family protein